MIIFGFGFQQPNGKHSTTVTIDCHVSLKLRASITIQESLRTSINYCQCLVILFTSDHCPYIIHT